MIYECLAIYLENVYKYFFLYFYVSQKNYSLLNVTRDS